jgi:hypothetical protein
VFREPRAASEVDATLAAYSKAIDESSAGALLLSVVGAKMSEVQTPVARALDHTLYYFAPQETV